MKVFRRKIYSRMLEWKECNGGCALMIEGARRVGKTTVVREFVNREYRSHIIIDFSARDKGIEELFHSFGSGIDVFFRELQRLTGVRLWERQSAIVFDEVQLFPLARQLIKHLVADGRYDYIETGSLISIKKNIEGILIPSEEMSVDMHPMDFEEFLWAKGDDVTFQLVRESFGSGEPLGESAHRRMMGLYTEYMIVGGMPQAVEALLKTNNYDAVENAKRGILRVYTEDAVKINARRILSALPSLLSKHDKSFSPGEIARDSRTRDYLDAVDWLSESKMVNVCRRVTDPDPAPDMHVDENSFKLYLLDTGLLLTAALMSNIGDRDGMYDSIRRNRLGINKGMLFENMVAQELVAADLPLRFCRFSDGDAKTSYEVDFLIYRGGKVSPVEAKSGISSRHASLDRFAEKYGKRVSEAYVIHTKGLRKDGDVTYVPIYMTSLLLERV